MHPAPQAPKEVSSRQVEAEYDRQQQEQEENKEIFDYFTSEAKTAQKLVERAEFVRNTLLLKVSQMARHTKDKDLSFRAAAKKVNVDRTTAKRAVDALEEQLIAGELDVAAEFEEVRNVLEEFRLMLDRNEAQLIEDLNR